MLPANRLEQLNAITENSRYNIKWEDFEKVDMAQQNKLHEYLQICATNHDIIPELRLSKKNVLYILTANEQKSGSAYLDQKLNNLIAKIKNEGLAVLFRSQLKQERRLTKFVQNLTGEGKYLTYAMWLLRQTIAAGQDHHLQEVFLHVTTTNPQNCGKRFFDKATRDSIRQLAELTDNLHLRAAAGGYRRFLSIAIATNQVGLQHSKAPPLSTPVEEDSTDEHATKFIQLPEAVKKDRKSVPEIVEQFSTYIKNVLLTRETPADYFETLEKAVPYVTVNKTGIKATDLAMERLDPKSKTIVLIQNLRTIRKHAVRALGHIAKLIQENPLSDTSLKQKFFNLIKDIDKKIDEAHKPVFCEEVPEQPEQPVEVVNVLKQIFEAGMKGVVKRVFQPATSVDLKEPAAAAPAQENEYELFLAKLLQLEQLVRVNPNNTSIYAQSQSLVFQYAELCKKLKQSEDPAITKRLGNIATEDKLKPQDKNLLKKITNVDLLMTRQPPETIAAIDKAMQELLSIDSKADTHIRLKIKDLQHKVEGFRLLEQIQAVRAAIKQAQDHRQQLAPSAFEATCNLWHSQITSALEKYIVICTEKEWKPDPAIIEAARRLLDEVTAQDQLKAKEPKMRVST